MKNKQILVSIFLASILLAGCYDDRMNTPHESCGEYPFKLNATIDHINVTRADDSGFAYGDRIGIYMVDYENGVPASLQSVGNHADNQSFVFDEKSDSWDTPLSLFFKDSSTPADFYGYYPYIPGIADVRSIPFSVQRNQAAEASVNGLSGYESSDLLWVCRSGVTPDESVVSLTFSHILAGVEVNLVEGNGFKAKEWSSLEKSVLIENTVRDGIFDLSTGSIAVSDTSDERGIIANPTGKGFRAVLLPQSVSAGCCLMKINIGSDSYSYQKESSMNYSPGKLHKFTFEVSKKESNGEYLFDLIGEAVTVWESDPVSHDGLARAYQVVDIAKGQRLQEVLETLKLNPAEIINLKLRGVLAAEDFYYMRDNCKKLQALNLKELSILRLSYSVYDNAIPQCAMTNRVTLKNIVLPDNLERIEELAFAGTILDGSLKIPEGVKYIGPYAFTNYWDESMGMSMIPEGGQLLAHNNLTGVLELPSTLEYIGEDAFRECPFTGHLLLPSSLRYIGANAFHGCRNFTGGFRLPDNLIEIGQSGFIQLEDGEGVFCGMTGLGGTLDIPKGLKVIHGFGGIEVSNILFPEGTIEIGSFAFWKTKVKGGIIIPDNVATIGERAFYSCNATSISLPEKLTRISRNSFENCYNLSDTLYIPNNVEVIESEAFSRCGKIEALILPSKLNYISDGAFKECFSLQYIHCDAKEPPVLSESAFNGIAKDNFTVEVPEESVDAYRNAPGWSEFRRISAYRNFVARPSKYNVLNKGGKKEFILNADDFWEVVECPSWCHIDKMNGEKKTVLTLTVDRMEHGSPNRSGKVVFKLKGSNDYETHINVGQYDYEYEEDSCVKLQNATTGNGIDIFLLGDGYDAMDISSGMLMKDMTQTMEYFFGVEPYTTYREYFNVYTAISLSEDSGVEELNKWRNTKFHTNIPQTKYAVGDTDWFFAFNYCEQVCPSLTEKINPNVGVILLANYEGFEGLTFSAGDSFCSLITKSSDPYPCDARGLVQHEAGGHGIGWLGDEYIYHGDFIDKCKCDCCYHIIELLRDHSGGFGLNLSINGKYKEVPWTHLVFHPSYADIVDIYEGGYFHSRGVYRSEYNSCMNNNVPYFSTWSRQLIVQRIMKLAGEQFSLEKFYANDSREFGRDFTVSRSTDDKNSVALHGNPPVFIKNYSFGKKGGRR